MSSHTDRPDVMHLTVASAPEVRRDLRKNSRWIFGLLAVVVFYVVGSSLVMCRFEYTGTAPNVRHWSFLHSAYFTVINITTVGFGDVVPGTQVGKLLAGVNAFAGLILFGLIVAVVSFALQPGSVSVDLAPGRERGPASPIMSAAASGDSDQLLRDLIRIITRLTNPRDDRSAPPGDVRERSAIVNAHIHRHPPDTVHIEILIRTKPLRNPQRSAD